MNSTGVTLAIMLWTVSLVAVAQIHYIPLRQEPGQQQKISTEAARISSLDLPFWDDFSYAGPAPDSHYWEDSENVFVNSGLASDPPSTNVASFDGLDASGAPYGQDADEGPTDALMSVPIDLSSYTTSDGLILSFFYQLAGNGDLPEIQDSIRVDYLDQDSVWHAVWPSSAQNLAIDGQFHQVLLPVNKSEYLHEKFRFRFQTVGRQSGAFDIWNVDYVYLNENRSLSDTSYPDRTISEPPDAILNGLYSMPYRHFTSNMLVKPALRVRNMTIESPNPLRAYSFDFKYQIDVTDSFGVTTTFANSSLYEPQESPIGLNTSEKVVIRPALPDFDSLEHVDSARIYLQLVLKAEDNKGIASGGDYDPAKYSPIDFRINDTTSMTYYLTDYYAYDDGSAELGAGLTYSGERLAYAYTLNTDEDYLTGIDIYFPYTGSDPEGKSIELTVWKDNEGEPGAALYKQSASVTRIPGKNKLYRYSFYRPVLVSGTFYIGYRQITQGKLAVGLDRNTSSGSRLFFNLDDFWSVNGLVEGSLMMRPVFEPVNPDLITGVEDLPERTVYPSPNPVTHGILYYNAQAEKLSLIDLNGREIPVVIERYGQGYQVDVSGIPSGVYILRCFTGNAVQAFRVVVR